jgi:hypothetical protein
MRIKEAEGDTESVVRMHMSTAKQLWATVGAS